MIVDHTGRPIKKTTATAQAVVFVSDDCENWEPVRGYNVPGWVREPDVMAELLNDGAVVFISEDGPFYRAERLQ